MARRPLTNRQLRLQEAQAALRGERAALKQQQARVAAARKKLDELSLCDCCGVRVLPCGADEQLCFNCSRARAAAERAAIRRAHGWPDPRR
jgi:multidrug resistance efflux pump